MTDSQEQGQAQGQAHIDEDEDHNNVMGMEIDTMPCVFSEMAQMAQETKEETKEETKDPTPIETIETKEERRKRRREKKARKEARKRAREGNIGNMDGEEREEREEQEEGDLQGSSNATSNAKKAKTISKKRLPKFEGVAPTLPIDPRRQYTFSALSDVAKAEEQAKYASALKQFDQDSANFKQSRIAWAKLAVAHEKNVPYEQRSKASLERECEARGLDQSGVKTVLEERLRLYDQDASDKRVTTSDMKVLQKVVNVHLYIDPQKQNCWFPRFDQDGKFITAGILDLSHDVIKQHLLVYFNEQTDYRSLYSLMRTCKYLHADVTIVLHKRSLLLFGEGGTTLALKTLFNFSY